MTAASPAPMPGDQVQVVQFVGELVQPIRSGWPVLVKVDNLVCVVPAVQVFALPVEAAAE